MATIIFFDSQCIDGRAGHGGDALSHVRNGGVVVFRDCLSQIGYAEKLRELTLAEMHLHCDATQIQRIESEGFEKVHEILSAQQIFDVNVGLTERMKPELARLIGLFASQMLGHDKRVYIYGLPVVRFFVPHDVFSGARDLFSKRQGFLQIQGPHHDTWFDHATESLNVWIAIGRVRRGNGLIVYPDHGKEYLAHDGKRSMPKSRCLGRSISFDLESGDIIFFHGETLHSSELNVTSETRYVVTNRFTLNQPRFKEHEQWQTWYDSALLGTALRRLAVWPTYAAKDYLLYKLKNNRLLRKLLKPKVVPSAEPVALPTVDAAGAGDVLRLNDMPVGEIRALTKDRCILKSEHGFVAFSRFCPHEGADLAHAVYVDGHIQCPWHHLSFNAITGQQPCQSLRHLKMFPVNAADLSVPEAESTTGGQNAPLQQT
jgi:nitrite reductase/ring-hydroxylating ferredoxin subunit